MHTEPSLLGGLGGQQSLVQLHVVPRGEKSASCSGAATHHNIYCLNCEYYYWQQTNTQPKPKAEVKAEFRGSRSGIIGLMGCIVWFYPVGCG